MGSVRLDGLVARYGRKTALHGLDLDIADGEFFVLLGPSGAGKTTTLKCVAGLVDGVEGRVLIDGADLTGVEPYHRRVAMAFESYALYPRKTVEQNLASPLRSGRSGRWSAAEQDRRIAEVTGTLGIEHLRGRFPRELSNGQRQRTALGRVLVRPAEVYLLDEPLSHLDAKLRAAMRAELKQLGELAGARRTTTLYVTHDYQEALALGDRVGVLREGRLVQVGTPEAVWNEPVDTFVARTLGQPEMNLLPATVVGGAAAEFAGGTASAGLPGRPPSGPAAAPEPRTPASSRTGGADVPPDGRPDGRPDGAVLVGIRPRDLELVSGPPPADRLVLAGRVRLAERLGRSVELSVDVAGQPVIVVTSDQRVREGDRVTLAAAWPSVHVFGADGARWGAARAVPAGVGSGTGGTA